jgi:hypothetical protein
VIRVILTDEARADALDAFAFYEERRPGLGARFRLEILLLLCTLAAWLVGLAGRTMRRNWRLQANTTRKRQVLSTFFIGRQLLVRPAPLSNGLQQRPARARSASAAETC